jgi:predicted membrane protein
LVVVGVLDDEVVGSIEEVVAGSAVVVVSRADVVVVAEVVMVVVEIREVVAVDSSALVVGASIASGAEMGPIAQSRPPDARRKMTAPITIKSLRSTS